MNARCVLPLSLVVIAAVIAGCAYQDPFALPPLGSPGSQGGPSTTAYYGRGPYPAYSGYGYGYGYGNNPYDYYRNNSYLRDGYAVLPYPPGAYPPYPGGPYCRDANRDGRCDLRTDAPQPDQRHDASVFEQLRDRLDARDGAGQAPPPTPAPTTLPRRPPPPIKVVPPKPSQPAVAQPNTDIRRAEQPAKARLVQPATVEP